MPPQERLSDGVRGSLTERTAAQPRPNAERRAGRSPEEEEREVAFLLLQFACHHLQDLHPHPYFLFLMTMPGWRRNLTFCLQRMHQEGRKPKQNERT